MKIEHAKVTVEFEDPNEILQAMNPYERLRFLQSMSCSDEIIQFVMDQVFQGCTQDGYYGSRVCAWDGDTPLQKFQKAAIDHGTDYVAQTRIKELERYLKSAEDRVMKAELELDKVRNPQYYR